MSYALLLKGITGPVINSYSETIEGAMENLLDIYKNAECMPFFNEMWFENNFGDKFILTPESADDFYNELEELHAEQKKEIEEEKKARRWS